MASGDVIRKGEGTERDRRIWREELKQQLVATCTICGLRWAAEHHGERCPVCQREEHIAAMRYAISLLREHCDPAGVMRADERFKRWQVARANPVDVKMVLP